MTHTSTAPDRSHRRALPMPPLGLWLIGLGMVGLMVVWLRLVGRPWICPCGTVALWSGDPHSASNSQQFADWYSVLHLMFGMGLFVLFDRIRPHWSVSAKLLVTVASSAIWEAMENLPILIAMFGNAANSPSYAGDSVLNAVGDTIFVIVGFFAARSLPLWGTIALAIGLEVLISVAADDGFVIGTLRVFGIPV